MTPDERELRRRIRDACCVEHGLTESGFEEHVDAIVRLVVHARASDYRSIEQQERRLQDRRRRRGSRSKS